ncbi:MAG: N-acetylneuraminate synthase family protein [Candidatus Omnitrophica bacterium]|nr:N-acetylneuraminate synthase family protein [Candidatus Omnitrophota bacterium]
MTALRIGSIDVGPRVLAVAEIGSNHNGDFALACRLVEAAAKAGADAVKFQTYRGEALILPTVPTLAHAAGRHRTQLERFKSLEFSPWQWRELAQLAAAQGVIFFSSAFDEESADLLDPLMPAYKIASGDLTNAPLLRYIARKGKPVILSTGMATEEEIARALDDLRGVPTALLHCVSRYPTPIEAANLHSIPFLRRRFKVPVGYSDHTLGIVACVGAAALGAVIIEKHFTLDKDQPLGDHRLSATPEEFRSLTDQVRQVTAALGVLGKAPGDDELAMRAKLRRGLYARRAIAKGAVVGHTDVIALRPEGGAPPTTLDRIVGRRAVKDIGAWNPLQEADVA